ncbi:MAG: hypothetical protein U1E65_09610 [Myxococcota bacterium]
MPHVIEPAKSGRASCRTCRKPIAKGELRFGEETPNAFAEGEPSFVWHHLECAAKKRPNELKSALDTFSGEIPNRAELEAAMSTAAASGKPKVPYAEHAPTGRSKCLSCEKEIPKGEIRVAVEREVDTGSFVAKTAGYLHLDCASMFVGDPDLLDDVKKNSRGLSPEDLSAIEAALAGE